jgi:hypothetical protein
VATPLLSPGQAKLARSNFALHLITALFIRRYP